MEIIHQSVLLEEVTEYLCVAAKPGSVFLDATLGSAGHTAAILERFPDSLVVANDQDSAAIERSAARLSSFESRVQTTFGNYSTLQERLPTLSVPWSTQAPEAFDGIIMDLGISSEQLAEPGRGFSFSNIEPLDMRMNQSAALSAKEVVNSYSPRDLKRVFAKGGLGPERAPLVNEIIKRRPIESTKELADICAKFCHKKQPAALPFQAIRIEVNQEFASLETFLEFAPELLKPSGRLAVISFHSLEDKIVAKTMRSWARTQGGRLPTNETSLGKLLTRKAIVPSDEEVNENPRARSARLRVFEKESI